LGTSRREKKDEFFRPIVSAEFGSLRGRRSGKGEKGGTRKKGLASFRNSRAGNSLVEVEFFKSQFLQLDSRGNSGRGRKERRRGGGKVTKALGGIQKPA